MLLMFVYAEDGGIMKLNSDPPPVTLPFPTISFLYSIVLIKTMNQVIYVLGGSLGNIVVRLLNRVSLFALLSSPQVNR